ncbi:MAG: hypothetical protein JWL99_6118 [Streptomyces oryziradicis]|nr:hypothetical protein [Actinacidiphila oryziradicis]
MSDPIVSVARYVGVDAEPIRNPADSAAPRSVRFSGATRIRDAFAGYLDAVRGNPLNGMVASLAFSRSSRINRRRM